jgi:hypothetical protein
MYRERSGKALAGSKMGLHLGKRETKGVLKFCQDQASVSAREEGMLLRCGKQPQR